MGFRCIPWGAFGLLSCMLFACSKPPEKLEPYSSRVKAAREEEAGVQKTSPAPSGPKPSPVVSVSPQMATPAMMPAQPMPMMPPSSPMPAMPAMEPQKPVEPEKPKCADQSPDCHPHRFLVADEPLRKLALVDLDNPAKDWTIDVPGGARDLQLIGNGRVLVGTLEGSGGYHEVEIATGKILKSVMDFGAVRSVQRLKNGNTLLAGDNLAGGKGTVIIEVKGDKEVVRKIEFPNVKDGRLIRRTRDGTYLMGASQEGKGGKDAMLEMTADGKEIFRAQADNWPAHMALRLPDGNTVVASGHGWALLVFDKNAKLLRKIGGTDQPGTDPVHPHYAGHFQILNNGNYVMTNWQGHEKNLGGMGRQLIEYNQEGKQVWSWKQDAKRFSAIHAVLVLDNLDLNQIYDDTNGALEQAR